MRLVKSPNAKNLKSGNVALTWREWRSVLNGTYTEILVIRSKNSTALYPIEEWMKDCAVEYDDGFQIDWVLMPVTKGSYLVKLVA